MICISRAAATLLGAALAGVLLWVAAQIGRHSTGGYWAAYAVVAAAGFVLALSQMRGRTGHPPAMFALGFVNSMFAMQLVMFVEQEFAVAIEDEDLDLDNFRSVDAISSLIERKNSAALVTASSRPASSNSCRHATTSPTVSCVSRPCAAARRSAIALASWCPSHRAQISAAVAFRM